jgi:hypothetical protein
VVSVGCAMTSYVEGFVEAGGDVDAGREVSTSEGWGGDVGEGERLTQRDYEGAN